ncbi:serine/threonine-protein kinase [Nannocystis punicea]|uniref:Serine/threonine-protein kinase n=1 Tax=Nannocystis punicea TaxID=2995304 RepID=A0ABY7GT89_9BACT|nr:serine/threonine-protein kinase [Nannocystis poenicansa]WAS90128.1 serine/threonine-protein kinase [Nannocystis poenicansa]
MASDAPLDLAGVVLEGRYQVVRLLGHGGMGCVFAGEDLRLKRACALKVLHPRLASEREHVERFLREAQMIASLDHPNIVDIYSYGEDPSGVVYFVMELLHGEDLDTRLRAREKRPFGVHHGCLWALQIAEAVAVVHDAGLIHRDLKAANVFLARRRDGEERCKLLDFGIARVEEGSDLTRTGITLGTPSYMSPEQVRNEHLDRRSDVYSFGVLLFKLLTGRVPFTGEPLKVAMAQCDTPPPRPSSLAPGISPNLEDIVLTALAKRPDERFQSMRALAAALRVVLSEEAPELAAALQAATSVTVNVPLPSASAIERRGAQGVGQDDFTPGASTRQTSATAMSQRAQSSRWLRLSAGVGVVTLLVLVAAIVLRGREEAAGPTIAGEAVAAPVTGEPMVPATKQAEPVVTAPPAAPPSSVPEVRAEPPGSPPPPEPELPPLASEVARPVQSATQPSRPADPLRQIELAAKKCRRIHKAVGGPAIEVDYAIGSNGAVMRAVPATPGALGDCLADAVRAARFPPKIVLGRKISL